MVAVERVQKGLCVCERRIGCSPQRSQPIVQQCNDLSQLKQTIVILVDALENFVHCFLNLLVR